MASFAFKKSPVRTLLIVTLKFSSSLGMLLATGVHADFLRCIDASYKASYADNCALCRADKTKSLSISDRKKVGPLHKGKLDYRISERKYESVSTNHMVFVERYPLECDLKLAIQAIQKSASTLIEVFFVLLQVSARIISRLTFYLTRRVYSPKNGRIRGMPCNCFGERKNCSYLAPRGKTFFLIYNA